MARAEILIVEDHPTMREAMRLILENAGFDTREASDGHTALSMARERPPDIMLDHPHYTRPAEFRGLRVPETLLSGNHAEIERWRREAALEKTRRNRPDLLER